MDGTRITDLATEQRKALEEQFGDGCEVGDVVSIVAIKTADGNSTVAVRNNAAEPHHVIGLIDLAREAQMKQAQVEGQQPDAQ